MKYVTNKIDALILTVLLLIQTSGFAQSLPNHYEVETLANRNPGKKDTREVNAILIFEKDGLKIRSRRSAEVFKEFKYTDIKSAEHSYSKKPKFSGEMAGAIALTLVTGLPIFLFAIKKDKHWLTVASGDDYAVLKIENDNFRQIRMELLVRGISVVDVNENRR